MLTNTAQVIQRCIESVNYTRIDKNIATQYELWVPLSRGHKNVAFALLPVETGMTSRECKMSYSNPGELYVAIKIDNKTV